jgi:hypothetical protein
MYKKKLCRPYVLARVLTRDKKNRGLLFPNLQGTLVTSCSNSSYKQSSHSCHKHRSIKIPK